MSAALALPPARMLAAHLLADLACAPLDPRIRLA
jgi:hypothetical protein